MEGGRLVKRALVLATLIASGLLATSAWAHQDNSFTYRATAGMFEDMYDYFKYSPAYLATFKKNAFWGQLSNLQSTGDHLFEPYTYDSTYMIGGQYDTGFGRAGLMIDWYSGVYPQWNDFYNEGGTHLGFGEGDLVEYSDRDGDGNWDMRQHSYGRSDETSKYSENDIYLAYSLGAFDIFQLGVGVRGDVWSYDPTYYTGHISGYNDFASGKNSFDYLGQERWTDLITGQEVYRRDDTVSGSNSAGYADWRPILAARTDALVQNLSLLLNLSPILRFQSNKVEYNYMMTETSAPAIPGFADDRSVTVTESGASWYDPLPSTAFGVAADLRADYQLTPGVLLTGWGGFETHAWAAKDAKRDAETTRWINTYTWDDPEYIRYTQRDTTTYNYLYDQKGGGTEASLKLRFQFPAKGWRLGLGIGGSFYNNNLESTETVAEREVTRYDYYNGDPGYSYTETSVTGDKTLYKYDYTSNSIELPIGLIIDLLPNLNLQMGARHTIVFYAENGSQKELERTVPVTTRIYDNGYIDEGSTPNDLNTWVAESYSASGQSHSNELMYGLTWWPYEQVQIDATAFYNLVELQNYRVSVSLYF